MNTIERRAIIGLAILYALRMLGFFLILPIFSAATSEMPGGNHSTLVGLAFGAFGLTQAIFQLPMGMYSDRVGRKRVIYLGLILFFLGSLLCATANHVIWLIVGRAVQGAGAISATVMAMLADLTREAYRTRAMAMIGGSIAVTFAISLVAAPTLLGWIGLSGIFLLTAGLSLFAVFVVRFYIPNPIDTLFHSDSEAIPIGFQGAGKASAPLIRGAPNGIGDIGEQRGQADSSRSAVQTLKDDGYSRTRLSTVLKNPTLLKLNYGVFALHATQMAMFMVIPLALVEFGLAIQQHWKIYLPLVLLGFALMVPVIIFGEKRHHLKGIFILAIALMLLIQLGMIFYLPSLGAITGWLSLYFVAFNILEAIQPSLISKFAPVDAKGTAMGVYNTCQSVSLFVGAALGGYLFEWGGSQSIFVLCAGLMTIWLGLALFMEAPRPTIPIGFQGTPASAPTSSGVAKQ